MDTDRLQSVEDLRGVYPDPGARGQAKVIHALDGHCRDFLARSPFFVLATADADGRCDASPKGGAPGFVRVLDDHRVAWADLSGNNRLDSFQNLVANPSVGLLCVLPGLDETLRINGDATLSTDPAVLDAVADEGAARPKVAVVVEVVEAYIHCAKAFRRSGLWKPDRWPDRTGLASVGCILRDHIGVDIPAETIETNLEANYVETLWEPGGR